MAFDLIRRIEEGARAPAILVVGDLILDRYISGNAERIARRRHLSRCSEPIIGRASFGGASSAA